jgi:deazaflavin-dependent oxidoreductase (nitroreductase family)
VVVTIENSPKGTYGTKMPGTKLLRLIFEPLAKRSIESYRKSGGTNRMSRMMGFPLVLLTTKGAKSGRERTSSLGGFADGDEAWLVVGSNGGSASHPSWFLNMVRNPDDIWLEVGKRKMKVQGESLKGAAREDAIKRIAAISARYGGYQKKTDRKIPVVRLSAA